MIPEQFAKFLEHSKDILVKKSDSEKVLFFIDWCKSHDIEETILRLSSETKGGWGKNLQLDFTTNRIIVSRKGVLRKFVDLGYVAGMAPYPYLLLKNKLRESDFSSKSCVINPRTLLDDPSNYYIEYSKINAFILRKGIETTVTNMIGRMIKSNFITIHSQTKVYEFTLPVNKNGNYEQIVFWLGVVVPVRISTH
ncbi:MAG: hypothetical protein WA395_13930 [Nitrososphaeraceae archaeon]